MIVEEEMALTTVEIEGVEGDEQVGKAVISPEEEEEEKEEAVMSPDELRSEVAEEVTEEASTEPMEGEEAPADMKVSYISSISTYMCQRHILQQFCSLLGCFVCEFGAIAAFLPQSAIA